MGNKDEDWTVDYEATGGAVQEESGALERGR